MGWFDPSTQDARAAGAYIASRVADPKHEFYASGHTKLACLNLHDDGWKTYSFYRLDEMSGSDKSGIKDISIDSDLTSCLNVTVVTITTLQL